MRTRDYCWADATGGFFTQQAAAPVDSLPDWQPTKDDSPVEGGSSLMSLSHGGDPTPLALTRPSSLRLTYSPFAALALASCIWSSNQRFQAFCRSGMPLNLHSATPPVCQPSSAFFWARHGAGLCGTIAGEVKRQPSATHVTLDTGTAAGVFKLLSVTMR